MTVRYGWLLAGVSWVRTASAADLGPLADFGPIGNGIIAVMFLIGACVVAALGVRAYQSYRDRDMGGGMGQVLFDVGVTIFAGVFIGVVLVSLITPIRAAGAVP